MKYLIPLFVSLHSLLNAQTITVSEAVVQFPSGTRNAAVTAIYWNDRKESILEWQSFLQKYKFDDIAERGKEVYVHNVKFKNIIDRPVDIYSLFEVNQEEKKIVMSSALDIGASNYLKSETNPAEFKIFENLLRDFALQATKKPLQSFIKGAANYQVKLNAEIKDLEKEKDNCVGGIDGEAKRKKSAEEKKLDELNKLKKKEAEISAQEEKYKALNDITKNAESEKTKLNKLIGEKKNKEAEINEIDKFIMQHAQNILAWQERQKKISENIEEKKREIEKQKAAEENWKKILSGVQ